MDGTMKSLRNGVCQVGIESVVDVLHINQDDIPPDCFLQVEWSNGNDDVRGAFACSGSAEFWPKPYKSYQLPEAKVVAKQASDGQSVTLTTDKPAFFVSLELGGNRVWSDNGFTLLPGQVRTLTLERELTNRRIPDSRVLHVQHLAH